MPKDKCLIIKELFDNKDKRAFERDFDSNEKCLQMLASVKWADGFVCRHCGNTNYCQGKAPFSRRCTACKRLESATADTFFHHCRMDLVKAFEIAYLVYTSPKTPASEIAQLHETRHMTCLNFKKRMLTAFQESKKRR